MCGRIDQDFSAKLFGTGLGSFGSVSMAPRGDDDSFDWENIPKRDDTRPTQRIAVITDLNGAPTADFIRWGWWFVKKNSRTQKPMMQMFPNSRTDTILQNLGNPFKTYNQALSQNRVIIPVRGYYEWTTTAPKIKYRFSLDDELMFLAGTVTVCKDLDKNSHRVVNIITRDAGDQVSKYHDREPVVLFDKSLQREWLLGEKLAGDDYLNQFFHAPMPELHIQQL
jgi:putative SOS response-associated peptidase YedK